MLEESIRSTGGTLSSFVRSILGTYTPTDPTSMAGADWEYIFCGILFCIAFYSVFRLIYAVFK